MTNDVSPILITGAARSGTSVVAGIIDICGAFGGKVTGVTPHNKKGQFENDEIRNHIIKPYLKRCGFDPMGQNPLPELKDLKDYPQLDKEVINVLKSEGWNGKEPVYYKGAKMCLMWPIWFKAFPNAKWIIVRRRDEEIVKSCEKVRFMKKCDDWQTWVDWHKNRFEEMKKKKDIAVKEVWPEKFIRNDDYSEIKDIIDWCSLDWDQKNINKFTDYSMYSRV